MKRALEHLQSFSKALRRPTPAARPFSSSSAGPTRRVFVASSREAQWGIAAGAVSAAVLTSLYVGAQVRPPFALDTSVSSNSERLVDLEEMEQHKTEDSLWVVLNGVVWDVTDFLASHPGGKELLTDNAGTDISELFKSMHPPGTLDKIKHRLKKVGTVFAGVPFPAASSAEAEAQAGRRAALYSSDFIVNLRDFEENAKEVLGEESAAWVYINSWADDGVSFLSARSAWSLLRLIPRVNIPMAEVDSSTTFLSNGLSVPLPLFMAPTGGSALAHPEGELNLTRASAKTQIPQCVSSVASKGIFGVLDERDALAAAAGEGAPRAPIWFQLYIKGNREQSVEILKKVAERGVGAILITVDSPVFGNRESHPRDARRKAVLKGTAGKREMREYDLSGKLGSASEFDANLSWDDISWVKSLVPNTPVLLKGISSIEDVALAKKHGADGVVLSNHGARQMEHSPPPIATLVRLRREKPEILQDPKFDVFVDGGIFRGTDVLKAVALGARGVGIGRTMLYAQACYGEEGVLRACEIFAHEIHRGMRLLGAKTLKDLKPEMVEVLDGLVGTIEK